MGLIKKRWNVLTGLSLENPNNWGKPWGRGTTSSAGIDVNEFTALHNIDVLTAVRIISETLASLPFPVYRKIPTGGKERAPNHPLYDVLQKRGNEEMTAFTLKETLQAHLLTWGNAYAYIERNDIGDCVGLWPLLPDRTFPFRRMGADGQTELWYQTRIKKLPTADPGDSKTFPASDVFHIVGMSYDGLIGYSVISHIRESIGLGTAQEQYGARFYANNTVPPVALMLPKGHLSEDAKDRILASWNEEHRGIDKQWKAALLEEGMSIQTIGIPPQDAEFLHSRAFTRTQILGFFRVPPHMVGDTEKSTSYGQGIEQQQIAFTMFTIAPWAARWEQTIDMKLLLRPRDDRYFAEVLIDGLQRSDLKTRYDAYSLAWGKWLTTDEIREKENQNAYVAPVDPNDAGKTLFVPLALAPAEKIIDGTARPGGGPLALTPGSTEPQTDDPSVETPSSTGVASLRRAIASAQRHVFVDIAERIIRREQTDIGRLLSKRNAAELIEALSDDHRDYVKKQMLPALRSYAALVAADVERELGRPGEVPDFFVEQYAESYARRHATASLADAQHLVGQDGAEAALASWTKRAAWIAERETIQAGNAFAKAAYRRADVRELVWSAGDDCADCQRLDGIAIKTDAVFVRRGEVLAENDKFIPASGIGHPPLCDGCGCVVISADPSARLARASDPEPPGAIEVLREALRLVARATDRTSAPQMPALPPIVIANDVSKVSELAQSIEESRAHAEAEREKQREDEREREAMNGEQMRVIVETLSRGQVELGRLMARAIERQAADAAQPTQPVQLVMPAGAIVVNVEPTVSIPPIDVNVQMPSPTDVQIVYDSQGRVVGTKRT